jgi:hypothetical protein
MSEPTSVSASMTTRPGPATTSHVMKRWQHVSGTGRSSVSSATTMDASCMAVKGRETDRSSSGVLRRVGQLGRPEGRSRCAQRRRAARLGDSSELVSIGMPQSRVRCDPKIGTDGSPLSSWYTYCAIC